MACVRGRVGEGERGERGGARSASGSYLISRASRVCQSMSLPIISQREGLKSISDIIEDVKESEC